ncbi:hypothetical protein I3760_03G134200 [Carya illinoinensis]|uniref:Retrotransposon gag domain-containing protein n=1 Tax=Carya illinoinensis TaxID=32201 RepID=A0A922FKP8_CARIL|nr:hypothetical protein I3760_03G134200 [Carya illinoinensis]KAG6721931.1 hypothetical protein I3842_03G136800 [Carya illinoinensis]
MTMILIAKNKLCFVDGTLPQPSKNDPLFHSQIRLTQEQSSVNAYFTHLNAIWNEIHNYHPFSMCSCGAMKTVVDFHQQEYVLQYLMGIYESFTTTRGQILLYDPLSSINKVFSLVVQEERQR